MTHSPDLAKRVRDVVNAAAASSDRSQQTYPGPSEVGHECQRRLAYKAVGAAAVNHPDTWAATIGTAVHAWLAHAHKVANHQLGRERYVIEQRVPWLLEPEMRHGSCDLYDVDTGTVIDFKVPGAAGMKAAKAGISQQYRVQAHLYGRGFTNLGETINHVAVVWLPRSGALAGGIHTWVEPYDDTVAQQFIDRWLATQTLAPVVGPSNIPAHPSALCVYCPFYNAMGDDPNTTCRGDLMAAA